MPNFLKDFFSVAISKGGIILFNLLQTIIVARFLGPELNGVIAALIVYPTMFMAIGSLGVRQSTAFYTAKKAFSENQIKKAVGQIWVMSTIFSLILCYLLIKNFSNSGNEEKLVWLAIAPIPFALFNTYNSGIYLGKNEIRNFNRIEWLPPLLVLLTTFLLIVILDLSVSGVLMAIICGQAIMTFLLITKYGFFNQFSLKFESKVIKSLLSLGIVYAVALLVITLNYKIDVILIDKLSRSYETGIYSKGAALVEYLWQIPMLLSTIIFARSANSTDAQKFSIQVCQLLRISMIIVTVGCLVLGLLAPWIIRLIFGEEFADSAMVLRILLPGVLLLTLFKVLNMDMAGRGKPWVSMKAMIPALIVNIGLNMLWIPKYGANGASFASTISYSIAAILFLYFYSKEVNLSVVEILGYKKDDILIINLILNKIKLK